MTTLFTSLFQLQQQFALNCDEILQQVLKARKHAALKRVKKMLLATIESMPPLSKGDKEIVGRIVGHLHRLSILAKEKSAEMLSTHDIVGLIIALLVDRSFAAQQYVGDECHTGFEPVHKNAGKKTGIAFYKMPKE